MKHEHFMRVALAEAQKGDMPYGAVLVKDDKIIIKGHNTTQTDNDVSAHAELNVLRSYTKQTKTYSLIEQGFQKIQVTKGILAQECLDLFKQLK